MRPESQEKYSFLKLTSVLSHARIPHLYGTDLHIIDIIGRLWGEMTCIQVSEDSHQAYPHCRGTMWRNVLPPLPPPSLLLLLSLFLSF